MILSMMRKTKKQLILASSSPFRKALLEQLGILFECHPPHIDESIKKDSENGKALALRLSIEKAQAIASEYPNSLIIGSDQTAVFNGQIFGKPMTHENAVKQLQLLRGQKVDFYTGLCLLNTDTGQSQSDVVPVTVTFRDLTDEQIENYLQREKPYFCACSAKVEGLGIALVSKIETDDYTSLIGLPLIRLTEMLKKEGIDCL